MKQQDQVTSLELSKKLKKLGVKQESLFWHIEWDSDEKEGYFDSKDYPRIVFSPNATPPIFTVPPKSLYYSAFTVAELGEMLPMTVKYYPVSYITNGTWSITMHTQEKDIARATMIDITEANARAKMLIYLLENDLLK